MTRWWAKEPRDQNAISISCPSAMLGTLIPFSRCSFPCENLPHPHSPLILCKSQLEAAGGLVNFLRVWGVCRRDRELQLLGILVKRKFGHR